MSARRNVVEQVMTALLRQSTAVSVNAELKLGPRVAAGVLLVEGFVSVSIQMIVLRQLVPVVGYSINVTSIVITIFLAALALGYRAGGRVRHRHAARIGSNLILAALLAAVGLSYTLVNWFFGAYFGVFSGTLIAVALYSLLVVAPLVYLLAQTVVLLINFREASLAAEQAGDTFHLSTIGNVVGGLFTTLIVMYYLGIAAAVVLDVTLLVLAYMMISGQRIVVIAFYSVAVCLIAFLLNIVVERALFVRTTAYADYYLADELEGEGRFLVVNGQNASRTDQDGRGHPYIEWFEDQIFLGSAGQRDILILGAGGFTFGQGRTHDSSLTFVDVDEYLSSIADNFLGSGARTGEYLVEDARAFLLRTAKRYDEIVLDTYSHRSSMPTHLMTEEFFALVRERLSEDGTVYMNIIGSDDERYPFTRGVDNTIRSVFARCTVHRINIEGVALYNKLYRCQRSALDGYHAVYTDRNTQSAMDVAL